MSGHDRDGVLFAARLEPARPLPPRALLLVLGGVAALSFASGAVFILHGAWPVTPFLGADVALLAWALHARARRARATEQVTLTADRLTVYRTDGARAILVADLNPFWARVEVEDRALALWSHGRRHGFAAFLGAEDREKFAVRLGAALDSAKNRRA